MKDELEKYSPISTTPGAEAGKWKKQSSSMNQAIQKLCSATSENADAAGWMSFMRASGKWTAWIS